MAFDAPDELSPEESDSEDDGDPDDYHVDHHEHRPPAARGLPEPMRRAPGAGPLEADVSPATIAADIADGEARKIARASKAKKTKTTADLYGAGRKKWFAKFCVFAQWDMEAALIFVNPATKEIKNGTFRQFFK